jgi:hypothetical protein
LFFSQRLDFLPLYGFANGVAPGGFFVQLGLQNARNGGRPLALAGRKSWPMLTGVEFGQIDSGFGECDCGGHLVSSFENASPQ